MGDGGKGRGCLERAGACSDLQAQTHASGGSVPTPARMAGPRHTSLPSAHLVQTAERGVQQVAAVLQAGLLARLNQVLQGRALQVRLGGLEPAGRGGAGRAGA